MTDLSLTPYQKCFLRLAVQPEMEYAKLPENIANECNVVKVLHRSIANDIKISLNEALLGNAVYPQQIQKVVRNIINNILHDYSRIELLQKYLITTNMQITNRFNNPKFSILVHIDPPRQFPMLETITLSIM